MDTVHWDDAPAGSVFSLEQYEDGEYQGCWGIKAWFPSGSEAWIALGEPAEEVVAPDAVSAQKILTELLKSAAALEIADAFGARQAPDLPDSRSFPPLQTDAIPEGTVFRGYRFAEESWGVIAATPGGEFLVFFNEEEQEAGFRTFCKSREEVQKAVDYLADHYVEGDYRDSQDEPPVFSDFGEREHFEDIVVALDRVAEKDRQRVLALEQEWLRRLELGNRRSCLCGQCRHEIRRQVVEIVDWFEKAVGFVPYTLEQDSRRLLDLLAKV